jgi:hypothetical protein
MSNLPIISNLLLFASFIQKCLHNIKQRISRHFIYKNIGKTLVKCGWNYWIIWLHHPPITASVDWWFTAAKTTQQISICHRPQCHRLQQQRPIHTSTGPHPAATPQTPPPLPSHRRLQAESRSPASCTIADSSGNSSQKRGKQENRSWQNN